MESQDVSLQRLNRLSDLVFASSMTILILRFRLPSEEQIASPELFEKYFNDSLPSIYLFIITFAFVAIYWVKDVDQFKYVVRTNTVHTWLQLASMAFLVLLPWVNALQEINPENTAVRILYCLDLFLVGFFSSLVWEYASHKHRLIDPGLQKAMIDDIRLNNLSEPFVALVAIIAALWKPSLYEITFILIPILFIVQKGLRERLKKWLQRKKSTTT